MPMGKFTDLKRPYDTEKKGVTNTRLAVNTLG